MDTLILTCGYRTSGKDYLAKQLGGGVSFNWKIFVPSKEIGNRFMVALIGEFRRKAFADELKKEVLATKIKEEIPDATLETCELRKDEKVFRGGTMSFRDFCIEHGNKMREVRVNYWSSKVFDDIEEELKSSSPTEVCCMEEPEGDLSLGPEPESRPSIEMPQFTVLKEIKGPAKWKCVTEKKTRNFIVTDCRMPDEIDEAYRTLQDKMDILSVRVFRSSVPIPPLGANLEHGLDHFCTDVLLVLSREDFKAAVQQFPQYKNYMEVS